jgi:hypothetical protein
MLSFEEVKSILVAVQSNPELHRVALQACEELYTELFIGVGSEHTGADIIASLNLNDPCHKYSLDDQLVEILAFEKDIERIKVDLDTEDMARVYLEFIKRDAEERRKYMTQPHFAHYGDDDEDYYYEDIDEDDHIDDSRFGWYPDDGDALLDRQLKEELKSRYDEILEKFKTTVFVELVNYKGEGESSTMLIKAAHLRKFYSKYEYGE